MLKPKVILIPLLLLFWGLWFLVAGASNLCDLLLASHILLQQWVFHSGNLAFIVKVIATYGFPTMVAKLMLLGVTGIELTSAMLFLWSLQQFLSSNERILITINAAFTLSVTLWIAFLIASEVFVFYAFTSKHLLLLATELICYGVIRAELISLTKAEL